MKVVYCSKTDKGKVREHNEDAFLNDERFSLFMLADGMGGYQLGDMASKLALSVIKSFLEVVVDEKGEFSLEMFKKAISLANKTIYNYKFLNRHIKDTGTTLVCFLPSGDGGVAVNIGDSRLYVYSNGSLSQVTVDHSAENNLPEFMKGLGGGKYSGVISRAIGPTKDVEADEFSFKYQVGDIILLCSDGLYTMVDNQMIEEILSSNKNLSSKCSSLVETANKKGGEDNITVTLVEIISLEDLKVLQMIKQD